MSRDVDGKSGGFVFDPGATKKQISDEEILEGLRRFSKKCRGRGFRRQDFEAWEERPFCALTAVTRFGSWHAALLRAGLPGARKRRYQPAELMEILERVWTETGYPPSQHALVKAGMSEYAFRRVWGSLPHARQVLADFKAGKISREELLRPVPGAAERERAKLRARRRNLSPSLRFAVITRDGGRCVICGQGAREGAVLEVDHVVPVCRGGGDGLENLRTLCFACNRGKGRKAG